MSAEKVRVAVEGRELALSNLDKVLYPDVGVTKGQVLEYYTRIAPALLPHLRDRPLTFKRYPDGVAGKSFFEKNTPSHAPEWVRSVPLLTPGSTKDRSRTTFTICDDLPTLIWAANLAVLEFHVPMWQVDSRGRAQPPDLMVFDLDPGPPATVVECCQVALAVRAALAEDGLLAYPKTSGSKGLQLYAGLAPERPWEDLHSYARTLAQRLERERPDLVVWNMKKALRTGKVLLDWSQNNSAKTTVAAYSLRARPEPTVSTPVTWAEVEACEAPADLRFTYGQTLARVAEHDDLLAPLVGAVQHLP